MPDVISHQPWYYIPTIVGTQVAAGGNLDLCGGLQSETSKRSYVPGCGTYVLTPVHPSHRQAVRAALLTVVVMQWVLGRN